jgi:UDP:flavonoid glycosyltransferase YjiC (YdhE family)
MAVKIVLTTFGSRGDVQPMLALALGLQKLGHSVLLAGPPEKAGWVRRLNCPYFPLGVDVTACVDTMGTVLFSFSAVMKFISMVRDGIRDQFRLLPEIVAGADLVVGSSLIFALSSIAEAMGIAYRYIVFAPQLVRSGGHPFPAIRGQEYPRWFNRLSWRMAGWTDKANLNRLINHHRNHLGLTPVNDAWLHIVGARMIVASDPAVSRLPEDGVPEAVQTGYMHLKLPDPESDRLTAFLNAGAMPVYAGFGSMPKIGQIQALPIIVEAVKSAGCRAVISKFWDTSSAFDRDGDIFFVRNYPHRSLFPRMAAIIHHGGAGTTATAAVSGRPQIIVPHVLDQFYWGHQIHQSHLGPRPIWRSRLKARKLAEAIEEAVSDSWFQQQAASVAGTIQRTDGVGTTISELLKPDEPDVAAIQ